MKRRVKREPTAYVCRTCKRRSNTPDGHELHVQSESGEGHDPDPYPFYPEYRSEAKRQTAQLKALYREHGGGKGLRAWARLLATGDSDVAAPLARGWLRRKGIRVRGAESAA